MMLPVCVLQEFLRERKGVNGENAGIIKAGKCEDYGSGG
jgi:hypothetical protein